MAEVISYPTAIPKNTDYLLGTQIGAPGNPAATPTKKFTVGSILSLGTSPGGSSITDTVSVIGGNATRTKVVTIPDGATSVDYTFGNDGFTAINLPDSLITIGNNAFQQNLLTSVTIPSTVTTIGDLAFYNNTLLTTVNIPSGVTSIGFDAFNLTDLTFADLIIPESCSVGSKAFRGIEVTGALTVENNALLSFESFGYGTFNNIVIGNNVSAPGPEFTNGPFVGAVINGTFTIGDNIDFGGMYWFNAMSGAATSVSFGPNFSNSNAAFFRATFDSYTFTGNPVNTIPDGATLGVFMFEQSGITSVTIGDNVTIGSQAFDQCLDIASLTLGDNVTMTYDPSYGGLQFSSIAQNISGGIPVTIPGTTTLAANSFNNANISTLTIESGVTEIPTYCFSGNTITSLSIPSTVLTFEEGCFRNQLLSGLTTLTLGSAGNPVTVGDVAFFDAVDLTTVNLPTGSTYNAGPGNPSFPAGATINFY
jgi:hypothetical protein